MGGERRTAPSTRGRAAARQEVSGDVGGSGADTTRALLLSGHLDGRCTSELRELVTEHVRRHRDEDLRLDMTAVESVDLTVLRLLAAVAVRLRRDGHQLVLVGCTPPVRRLLSHGVWRRLFVVRREHPSDEMPAPRP